MNLRKVTLKAVSIKPDKPTASILIDTRRGEEWASGFINPRTKGLNKGETVYVHLFESEYNGKKYLNFELPSIDHLLALMIEQDAQKAVSQAFQAPSEPTNTEPFIDGYGQEQNPVKVEDIPF